MASLSFRVKNLPSGANRIVLWMRNVGEAGDFAMDVYPPPSSWTCFPKTPYHDWGNALELKYIALDASGRPIGTEKLLGFQGNFGDHNWMIDYSTGHISEDRPSTAYVFPKITEFILPEKESPGVEMNISVKLRNTSPTAGYVYARFSYWNRIEWVDIGQDKSSVWLEPNGITDFSPFTKPVMPPDIKVGEGINLAVSSFTGGSGVWYGADKALLSVWTKAKEPEPAQLRDLLGIFS